MTQTSVFVSGIHQSHSVSSESSGPASNFFGPFTAHDLGDSDKEFFNDPRNSLTQIWELGKPNSGGAIPKNAIIKEVRLEFVPTLNTISDDGSAQHTLAIMASDGHWDRSRQSPLHKDQGGGITYSAPSVTHTMELTAESFDGDSFQPIGQTIDGASTVLFNSRGDLASETLGCTVLIAANAAINRVVIPLGRFNTPFVTSQLQVSLYELHKNTRHSAPERRVATTTSGVDYNSDLPDPPNTSNQIFTFETDIPEQAEDRWVGFLIEGTWFQGLDENHGITCRVATNSGNSDYLAGTAGSMLHASRFPSRQFPNSLPYYYHSDMDVPVTYEVISSTAITTPYARFVGSVMGKPGDFNEAQVLDWENTVTHSYGSVSGTVDTLDVFPELTSAVQDWIDSDDYDPLTGRTWMGIMIDVASANDTIYQMQGALGDDPIKLIINWEPRRAFVT